MRRLLVVFGTLVVLFGVLGAPVSARSADDGPRIRHNARVAVGWLVQERCDATGCRGRSLSAALVNPTGGERFAEVCYARWAFNEQTRSSAERLGCAQVPWGTLTIPSDLSLVIVPNTRISLTECRFSEQGGGGCTENVATVTVCGRIVAIGDASWRSHYSVTKLPECTETFRDKFYERPADGTIRVNGIGFPCGLRCHRARLDSLQRDRRIPVPVDGSGSSQRSREDPGSSSFSGGVEASPPAARRIAFTRP